MKNLLAIIVVFITTTSIGIMGQRQFNADFTAGSKITMDQNTDNLPEMRFYTAQNYLGTIGLTPRTNNQSPNIEDFTLRNNTEFGDIRFEVNSGAMIINANTIGNGAYVGINTNSPTVPLSVNIINGGAAADFLSTNTNKARIQFSGNDGTSITTKGFLGVLDQSTNFILGTVASNTTGHLLFRTKNQNRMAISNDGDVFIGNIDNFPNAIVNNPASLNICGNTQASGSLIANAFNCSSDKRYKTDIMPIQNALTKVLNLDGVTYQWNTKKFPQNGFTDDKQIGLIAQEVENILPELVSTNETGYKSVDYVSLTAVLVEAIKEQQQKIEELEGQIENTAHLESRLKVLEQVLKSSEFIVKNSTEE